MSNLAIIVNFLQGGGAERCAADLSVYFAEHGFNIFIFMDLTYDIKYEYKGKLVNFTYQMNGSGKDAVIGKVDELRRLKEQYDIDISISFMQFANYMNILSKGREKVILTTHSVNSEYAKYDKSVFWAEETFSDLYQYADLITFPSEYCRKDWIGHYGDKKGITRTIYNPVHAMPITESENKKNIIITVGRLHGIKRQWHIIRAFKRVKENLADSKLIILGEGELKQKLEDLIDELGLNSEVEMPGNVTNVQDYLKMAKVFVITSRMESMGCAPLEAMNTGVPVVSCDFPGGIREVIGILCSQKYITEPIHGECGVLVPDIKEFYTNDLTEEEKILADEIVQLLKDDKTRCDMGEKARVRASCFSLECIGKKWMEEIASIIRKRPSESQEFYIAKEKSINSISEISDNKYEMYISYFRLLEKWMVLREKNVSTGQYFQKYGMKNIIIYGMGKMAHHLLEDLKGSQIKIVCAIDRSVNNCNFNSSFPVITGESEIPNADCIIITPVYEASYIKQELEGKTSLPVISLSEVIEKCI